MVRAGAQRGLCQGERAQPSVPSPAALTQCPPHGPEPSEVTAGWPRSVGIAAPVPIGYRSAGGRGAGSRAPGLEQFAPGLEHSLALARRRNPALPH